MAYHSTTIEALGMTIMKSIAASLALAVMPTIVVAGDARQGEALARQWCSNCHLIGADQAAGGDAAPTFAVIAETAEERTSELTAWLADPHPPMPNLNLTRVEIDDLLAYIKSLRQE